MTHAPLLLMATVPCHTKESVLSQKQIANRILVGTPLYLSSAHLAVGPGWLLWLGPGKWRPAKRAQRQLDGQQLCLTMVQASEVSADSRDTVGSRNRERHFLLPHSTLQPLQELQVLGFRFKSNIERHVQHPNEPTACQWGPRPQQRTEAHPNAHIPIN